MAVSGSVTARLRVIAEEMRAADEWRGTHRSHYAEIRAWADELAAVRAECLSMAHVARRGCHSSFHMMIHAVDGSPIGCFCGIAARLAGAPEACCESRRQTGTCGGHEAPKE